MRTPRINVEHVIKEWLSEQPIQMISKKHVCVMKWAECRFAITVLFN